jgi:hypothetical protein
MRITFGWCHRDPDEGKYQIHLDVHGGNSEWTRHQAHNTSWIPHEPSEEDRERLVAEAERRVPRRLITQKQFEEIKTLSQNDGSGKISGKRVTGLGPSYN